MKKLLLLTFLFCGISSFAQNNAPIAINDTITLSYDQLNRGNSGDTNTYPIFIADIIANDFDPNGNPIFISDIQFTASNSLSTSQSNGNKVFSIEYKTIHGFFGLDTIKYTLRDDQFPILIDTGYIFIQVKKPIHAFLEANNIKARVDVYSIFGTSNGQPGFLAPVGQGTSSIFQANLWMAGINNGNPFSSTRKFMSAQGSYNPSNSGPISNFSNTPATENEKWEKVWKVTKNQIEWHLNNYSNPGYSVPSEIANWPAHGDIRDGEAQFLAPFIDQNGDNFYDPLAGDYPEIKGDQAIYFIYNDELSVSGMNSMKTETHVMVYAFQCQDSAIQNTIFVDYKIYNRSNNVYDSTVIGMWADFDIGNAQDDFVQCDVTRSLFYGFNGDAFDDDNSGRPGYGAHPPGQGVLLLQGPIQDADGLDNNYGINTNESINGNGFGDGTTDNEYWGLNTFSYFNNDNSATGDPRTDIEYYNCLKGNWKMGEAYIYGGNGYPTAGGPTQIPAKFLYPGASDPLFFGTGGTLVQSWTEASTGNSPADRRGVGSSGPITFAPGDEIELKYAFVFGRDYVNSGAQAGVDNMLERADSIRSYHDQGMLSPCGDPVSVNNSIKKANSFSVYPNPVQNVINISQDGNLPLEISIIDVTGKMISTKHSSNSFIQINTSLLAKGVYVVRITGASQIESQVIVKE